MNEVPGHKNKQSWHNVNVMEKELFKKLPNTVSMYILINQIIMLH